MGNGTYVAIVQEIILLPVGWPNYTEQIAFDSVFIILPQTSLSVLLGKLVSVV